MLAELILLAESDGSRGRLFLNQRGLETVHYQQPSFVFRVFCSAEYDTNKITISGEWAGTRRVAEWRYFLSHHSGIFF
jgi:hypothetical protein